MALGFIEILLLVGVAAVFCILPTTIGTCFATKLQLKKAPWWNGTARCFELGILLTYICSFFFLITVLGMIPDASGPFELDARRQIMIYVVMIALIVGIYRETLRWWWRLLMIIGLILGLIVVI